MFALHLGKRQRELKNLYSQKTAITKVVAGLIALIIILAGIIGTFAYNQFAADNSNPTLTPTPSPIPTSDDWFGPVVSNTAWMWDTGTFFSEDYVELFASKKATAFRVMMNKEYWDDNRVNNLGIHYKTFMSNVVKWCHNRGINCYLDLTLREENFEEWEKAVVITDASERAAWINWGKDVISTCHPDGIGVMNEDGGTTMTQWLSFVSESISAYRSVDNDITIFVSSMPYYNVEDTTYKKFMLAYDSKVIMEYHLYYDYPSASGGYDYAFNLYGDGNLAQGKKELYKYLDSKFANFPKSRINWAEFGVGNFEKTWHETGIPDKQNWQQAINDMYEYVDDRGLHGAFQFATSFSYPLVHASSVAFTPYGQVFADYLKAR